MVIPLVFLLLVVVSPTAAIIDTDGAFDDGLVDSGGIGGISGGGDGNLGLGFIAASLIGLTLLAALAGRPGQSLIMTTVPTPTVCPTCPTMTATVCPTCPTMTATVCPTLTPCTPMPACPANYQRLVIPAGVVGDDTVLQSCYRVKLARNPPFVDFLGASQLCDADNAVPVEFNIDGEFAAVARLLIATPIAGSFFTGHSDAFNTIDQGILGINSGVAPLGIAFPNGVLPGADCGVITGAAPTSPACRINQSGVICEIRLDGATCFCPAGTG